MFTFWTCAADRASFCGSNAQH